MDAEMVFKERGYRFDSHKFYPRPSHFKKRLDSLIGRFSSLVGAFGESFQDPRCRQIINESYQRTNRPMVVQVTGNEDFKIDRFVIIVADEWATVPEPASLLTSGEAGVFITVCYIKVEDTALQGKTIVRRVIDHLSQCLNEYSKDQELFKSLFVFCETTSSSESEISSCRSYINDILREKSASWPGENRIVMGPDQVTLGSIISDYVEDQLFDTFWLIYEYLERFIDRRKSHRVIHDVAHVDMVEKTLYAFVRNDLDLSDAREQLRNLEDGSMNETEKFVDIAVDILIKKLNCVVADPLGVKLGLKLVISSICLHEIRFDKIVKKHLSKSTRRHLKTLHDFSQSTDDAKVRRGRRKYKGNDYMVHSLQNDLSAALSEIEQELKKAVRHISTMEKMQYEIEGYFRLAGIQVGEPPVKIPEKLQKDLLNIDGVVGAGTVYGKLEVHVNGKINGPELGRSKLDIDDTIKKHKYAKHYVVRSVVKEALQLANVQHEHGNTIKSPFPGRQNLREGTLGIFAEGQQADNEGTKRLYALTCAHVVNPFQMPELPVYVYGNGARLRKFGVSKPELTVTYGMEAGARLIDIAAVQVDSELQRDCLRYVKNEEGFPKRSFVLDSSVQELARTVVYKFGANTGRTRGLICSSDYIAKINGMMDADYIVVIDKLPGTDTDFAKPGDSGSIVCMPSIDRDRPVGSVAVVAMVHAGELELEGFDSNLCFSFLFCKGLEILAQKSGLQLRTP